MTKGDETIKTTTPQLITILFGVVLIVGMGLYPPWRVEVRRTIRCCAYGSLFSPPQTVGLKVAETPVDCIALGLDTSRLFVQWAVVALAVAGAIVMQELGRRRRQESGALPRPPSVIRQAGLR